MTENDLQALIEDLKTELAVINSILDALQIPQYSHTEDRLMWFIKCAQFGVPEELVQKASEVYGEIPY